MRHMRAAGRRGVVGLAVLALTAGAFDAAVGRAAAAGIDAVDRVLTQARNSVPTASGVGLPHGLETPEIPGGEADIGLQRVGSVMKRPGVSLSPRPGADAALRATSAATLPQIKGVDVAADHPGRGRSWQGISAFDNRYAAGGNQFTVTPPDQALCVGNGYVLESVNDALRIYRTTGAAASGTFALNEFYGYPPAIDRSTFVFGPSLTDPTCVYDAGSRRLNEAAAAAR